MNKSLNKFSIIESNNNFVNILIVILSLSFLLFFCIPEIDIKFSNLFFINREFIYKNNYFAVLIFESIPTLTKIFVIITIFLFIYSLFKNKINLMFTSLFFLLSAAIGPGLIVNELLKNNFGRPRPDIIIEFDGKHKFVKPLEFSNACKKNCSFSSGHASMGYYFTSISYLFRSRKFAFKFVFSFFFLFGSMVGLMRIIQGRHFLSDVIFSALITILVNHIISFYILKYTFDRK